MVSIKKLLSFIESYFTNRKQGGKIKVALVSTRESLQGYHKALSWNASLSIFLLMIYFLLLKNQPYITNLMIIHFTHQVMMQTLPLVG